MSLRKASASLVSRSSVGFTPTGGGAAVTISNVIITDSNWNNLDDTAISTLTSYIKIIGSGFAVNPKVYIETTQISSGNITFVSPTELRVIIPSQTLGNKNLFVFNANDSGAIWAPGLLVSGTPDFTVTSYLTTEPTAVSIQLLAIGDAPLTYSVQSGSTLPAGLSLSSSGLITGSTSDGTYQFTIIVDDAQLQSFQSTITLTVISGDPYFNRTVLAINSEADTFVKDGSSNNYATTITGDTKPFAFSPYNTNWSIYIDGSDDLNAASNAAFTYGTADFTIEGWFYVTGRSGGNDYEYFFAQGANTGASALGLYRQGDVLKVWQGGPSAALTGTTAFSTLYNRWVHIALTRSGTTMRLFLNGALEGSATNSGNITTGTTTGISIGRWTEIGDGNYIIGYVSNFRVVKGTAVYTSAFTPSTTPLTAITNTSLLTCQDNRFIDKSTNNFTLTKNGDTAIKAFGPFTETDTTTGSGYFDGTGDYLSLAGSSAFVFGTGDFTIETWVYIPVNQAQYSSILGNSSNPDGWFLSFSTSNIVNFSNYNVVAITSSSAVPLNTWTHIAVARSGTSLKMFFNGVQVASATNSTSYGVSATTYIGFNGTSYYINGYVSDVRIIKGTAVYTANFTPPTSPLTAITNTQVLTLQTRQPVNNHTFIDSCGLKNIVTKNGNASQGSFSPFSPAGWSNYFDGTGDYLTAPSNAAFTLGSSGDFTIECWFYLTASPSNYAPLMTTWTNASNSYINRWAINFYNSKLSWYTDAGNLGVADTSNIELNTWIHVAVVRNGSNITMYKNGVSLGVQSTVQSYTTDNTLSIGYIAGGAYITGYISNARIVKGTAVYTSNFTPPTTALSAVANTSLLTCQSNRFIDNSTNIFTITKNGDTKVVNFSPFKPATVYSPATHGGSAYFDGSDYLQTNSTDSGLITTGPFTIEAWVYPLAINNVIVSRFYWQTGDNGGWSVSINSSGYLAISYTNGTWNNLGGLTATSNPVLTGQWNHIAITRDSSNLLRLFVNGKSSVTPITVSQTMDRVVVQNAALQPRTFRVAVSGPGDGAIGSYYTGYISSINIQANVAKYTADFTLPSQPISAESGSTFSSNMNSAGIIDISSRNVMETVGDAKIVTSTKKFGAGSMSFDGTGDYIISRATDSFILPGNFTIEGWAYLNASGNYRLCTVGDSVGASGIEIYVSGGNWTVYSSNAIRITGSAATRQSWTHIAVVRSGSTITLYVNGTASGSTWSSSSTISGACYIGAEFYNGSATADTNGYIDDLRITKFARYTANFTPPTSTFLTQ